MLYISKNFDRKNDALVNENIKCHEVLVIDETGESLGVKGVADAIKIAQSRSLDLVCVAPNAKTPVCRFMDYSKFRYEQQRKAREAKKHQKIVSVKEIWLTPVISIGDFETKLKRGRKFLEDGNKLKVTLRYRSYRMLNNDNITTEALDRYLSETSDIANLEAKPKLEGKNMSMILVPNKDKK